MVFPYRNSAQDEILSALRLSTYVFPLGTIPDMQLLLLECSPVVPRLTPFTVKVALLVVVAEPFTTLIFTAIGFPVVFV
jgi:hypothetical protein